MRWTPRGLALGLALGLGLGADYHLYEIVILQEHLPSLRDYGTFRF